MDSVATSNHPLRGIVLLTVGILILACMDTTTKYLSAVYAIPLILAVRYSLNLLLMLVVLGPRQGRRLIATRRTGLVILRALCLVAASLCFGFALQRMPIAEATSIVFLGPMLVAIAAGPLLGERVGAFGWAALILGFGGVLLIVRPGSGLDPVAVGFLAIAVAGGVAYNILSRVLARTETTTAMLFVTALAGTICFGAAVPWSLGGPTPGWFEIGLFFGLGVASWFGHFLFTAAYRYAPASLLAPVNYLQLVWAGLLGWLIFGHVPDTLTVAGMLVVAAAGIFTAALSSRPVLWSNRSRAECAPAREPERC